MAKRISTERKIAMYKAIMELRDLDECCAFFDDLCAATELRTMEQRYEVASMLEDDKVYTEIMQATNASTATISRVKRMLNFGTGCIGEVIRRVKTKEKEKIGL